MEWNATAASYPVKCPKCGSINKVKIIYFNTLLILM